MTQRAAATGSITLESLSASGAVTLHSAQGEGSGDIAVSTLETSSTIDITGSQNGALSFNTVSAASGLTINMTGSGSITASAIVTQGTFTMSRPIGSASEATINMLSAADASITLGAVSAHFGASVISVGSFTFDSTGSLEESSRNDLGVLSASGVVSINRKV